MLVQIGSWYSESGSFLLLDEIDLIEDMAKAIPDPYTGASRRHGIMLRGSIEHKGTLPSKVCLVWESP
jgi:hypothetical protein